MPLINVSRFYRIWFSPYRYEFLGLTNRARFAKLRADNPEMSLSFVYSSKRLSPEALNQLKQFCEKLHIRPVDFDLELPTWLQTSNDKKLLEIARLELTHAGGSEAGASDRVRLMEAVVIKLGNYAEFDLELKFKNLQTMEVASPVILDVRDKKDMTVLFFNTDFLGFAVEPSDKVTLTAAATKALRQVQSALISRFEAPLLKGCLEEKSTFSQPIMLQDPHEVALLRNYNANHNKATILDFKAYVAGLTKPFRITQQVKGKPEILSYDQNRLSQMKQGISVGAVTLYSGGEVFSSVIESFFIQKCISMQGMQQVYTLGDADALGRNWFKQIISEVGVYGSNGLEKYVSQVSYPREVLVSGSMLTERKEYDCSWQKSGRRALKRHDTLLKFSGRVLFSFFQKHRDNIQEKSITLLTQRMDSIIQSDLKHFAPLSASLQAKNYNQALRRLTNDSHAKSYAGMKILLNFERPLRIDVNQGSEAKDSSPMHLALKLNDNKKRDLLLQHHAKPVTLQRGLK